MGILGLIVKEIAHRKLNFLLSLLGVVAAAGLFVAFFTASQASLNETKRLMRNMGLNIRIVPKETDMVEFGLTGVSKHTMPEQYVHDLARYSGLNYSHLLPTLRHKVAWRGGEVIVVGLLPEISPIDKKKPSMSLTIEPGSAQVGYAIAQREGLAKGDSIDIAGKTLAVTNCLSESGTQRDSMIFAHLRDVQAMFGLEGRLNEIQALDCYCADQSQSTLERLREQLAGVLPDTKVVQIQPIAQAREQERRMVEDYLALIIPFVLVICAAWVGLLALINVRERRQEIGIMRALGYGSQLIASLFLGKAFLVGILGAVVGFYLGTSLALHFGPMVFQITGKKLAPMYDLLWWSVIVAPLFAAVAASIPTMVAVAQDPAVTLRED